MRPLLIRLGCLAIITYASVGAALMNSWAVTAASGFPLDRTMADMAAAGEPYSAIPGYFYFGFGVLLAVVWGTATLIQRFSVTAPAALSLWAWALALGAPTYLLFSTRNLMSIGDTYYDWNPEAAGSLSVPLYVISGVAFVIAIVFSIVAVAQAGKSARAIPA